jgi:hypothetical protein
MPKSVTMVMTPESKASLRKLSRAELVPELRKALTASTNGAVPAVRSKVREMPSKKRKRTKKSLRSQVAMAIKRKIGTSSRNVSVVILSQPHGGLANLARCVEGEIIWKHPTFGHPPTVVQTPYPFFYHTLDAIIPGTSVKVREALIRFERRI